MQNNKRQYKSKITMISKEHFEDLVRQGNDINTVCSALGIVVNTLRTWCKKTYGCNLKEKFDELHGVAKSNLINIGWNLAEKNSAAWIFMMKNLYGWSDQPVVQPSTDASDSLSDSFKVAAKSIGSLASLASVPSVEDEE